jgi:hypothetical protein
MASTCSLEREAGKLGNCFSILIKYPKNVKHLSLEIDTHLYLHIDWIAEDLLPPYLPTSNTSNVPGTILGRVRGFSLVGGGGDSSSAVGKKMW